MRILEVLVDDKDLIGGWSEVYLGSDGQPRYRSNNGLVGTGTRITRVSDDQNTAPQVVVSSVTATVTGSHP